MPEVKLLVTKTEFNTLPTREMERRMCKWSEVMARIEFAGIPSGFPAIHPESAAIANPASNLPEPLRRGPRVIRLSVLNPCLVDLATLTITQGSSWRSTLWIPWTLRPNRAAPCCTSCTACSRTDWTISKFKTKEACSIRKRQPRGGLVSFCAGLQPALWQFLVWELSRSPGLG